MVSCHIFTILNFQGYYCYGFFIVNVGIIKKLSGSSADKRLRVSRLCSIEQLYNLEGYNLITNNNQLNKGGLALYIKSNIPVTIKSELTFIRNGI